MSTYKKLNKQDAFITTYTAHKKWAVTGDQFSSYGINLIPSVTGVYGNSLKQLYYPTKQTIGNVTEIPSHSFDYYNQTTLNYPESRNPVDNAFVISLPRSVVGTHLNPGIGLSFIINEVQQILYASSMYMVDEYSNDPFQTNQIDTLGIDDDGDGNLYISASNPREYVGDIIYTHGIISITNPIYSEFLKNAWNGETVLTEEEGLSPGELGDTKLRKNLVLEWESSQPIFTHNYHCKIRDFEYNYTYNPSALSGSIGTAYNSDGEIYSTSSSINKGDRRNNITGSAFQPYITTIGLYNDANELIAVGKTTQPVPKSANTEMTIIVKIDI
jgi:hypothetical protein